MFTSVDIAGSGEGLTGSLNLLTGKYRSRQASQFRKPQPRLPNYDRPLREVGWQSMQVNKHLQVAINCMV
jgi:hypothetical protein